MRDVLVHRRRGEQGWKEQREAEKERFHEATVSSELLRSNRQNVAQSPLGLAATVPQPQTCPGRSQ
jgi:hypothetical protein